MALLWPVSGLPWAIMSSQWHCTLPDLAFIFHFQDNPAPVVFALLHQSSGFWPSVNILVPPSARHMPRQTLKSEPREKKYYQRNQFTNQFCYKLHNLARSLEVGLVVHKSPFIVPSGAVYSFLLRVSRSIWNHSGMKYAPHLLCLKFVSTNTENLIYYEKIWIEGITSNNDDGNGSSLLI